MKSTVSASDNPKSNRTGPVITAGLIAEIRSLARLGYTAWQIADHINWPWHCNLRRIHQWMDQAKRSAI